MRLAFVCKQNKPMVNMILGAQLYYQNQPFLDPEIGIGLCLLFTVIQLGIRLEPSV
jgi:hypothetical protein